MSNHKTRPPRIASRLPLAGMVFWLATWLPALALAQPAPLPRPEEELSPRERRELEAQRLRTPSEETRKKIADFIHREYPLEAIFRVDPTRSRLLRTKLPVSRIAITDPEIVEVIEYGPTEFEFIGRQSGETTLTMWFGDPGQEQTVVRYLVVVEPDRGPQERAEIEYGDLQRRLNELFPNSQIQLIPVLDKLMVRGQARDPEEATQIMTIIRGETIDQSGYYYGPGYGPGIAQGAAARIPGAEDLPAYNVISLLRVPGEQQVLLKVRVAEITRTALRQIGFDFAINEDNFSLGTILSGAGNITAILDGGDLSLFLQAFNSNGMSKVLAEPTLVTLSGRPASFIAGGQFAVPTVVGVDGIGAATTTFQSFGTQLTFLPVVLDKDKVRLTVTPTVSEVNQALSVNGIPGLDTRTVSTTVDLREGQWLAIAGLIQDEQAGARTQIPFLGDIPILGSVFGNQEVTRDETELVVLVSPELVHPMEPEQVPLFLPGMNVTEPCDADFYFNRQIEGRPWNHHRSTIFPRQRERVRWANLKAIYDSRRGMRMESSYQTGEDYYISGPSGFSE